MRYIASPVAEVSTTFADSYVPKHVEGAKTT